MFTGVPTLAATARALYAEERGRLLVIATHMHAGDGNVHVNIPVFSNDREMLRRANDTANTAMRHAVDLGGVVPGEHGIGITKIGHLEPERLAELRAYRTSVDPTGLMNPGKLDDPAILERVFTPSFNLLKLEARILQHDQLEGLAKKIQTCVRCGKCKPECCVFYPARGLFYHPRNKNLAIGSIIEAVLYDAQRSHGAHVDALRYLRDVADHCTICHKCQKPCPVDIDTGAVSLLERSILKTRWHKRTGVATRLSLSYLDSRNRLYRTVFRTGVLQVGVRAQRLGARVLGWLPPTARLSRAGPVRRLGRPLSLPSRTTLPDVLPPCGHHQVLVIKPTQPTGRAVFYFPGCGSERLFGDVGQAAVYILLAAGATVVLPPPALCCGFPFGVNAYIAERKRIELRNAIVFSQVKDMLSYLAFDAIAVSCGTCREALQHLGAAAIFDAPIEDAAAWALSRGLAVEPLGDVLYHAPCHDSLNGHAATVFAMAGGRARRIPACCGEAGTMALSRPDIADKLFDRKEDELRATGCQRSSGDGTAVVLTNCPACLQGLGRQERLGITAKHLAVRLAEASNTHWHAELSALARHAEVVTI